MAGPPRGRRTAVLAAFVLCSLLEVSAEQRQREAERKSVGEPRQCACCATVVSDLPSLSETEGQAACRLAKRRARRAPLGEPSACWCWQGQTVDTLAGRLVGQARWGLISGT